MARAKNVNLKKPHQELSYTHKQVHELKKCAQDPVYFVNNYVKIQHPMRGAIPFKLYDYQERIIEAYQENRHNILLASRQVGKCFFYSTMINIIKQPKTIKKILLWVFNRKKYNEIFKKL